MLRAQVRAVWVISLQVNLPYAQFLSAGALPLEKEEKIKITNTEI